MRSPVRTLLVMARERRQPILEALERCEAEVVTACTVAEAVHTLGARRADVVIADAALDWTTMLGAPGAGQVILATDRLDAALCAEAYRLGVFDVLAPPYSTDDLRRVLVSASAKSYRAGLAHPAGV